MDTVPNQGWQRPASVVLEKNSLDELRRQLMEPERALMLSQGGPMAAEPFPIFPTSRETRFDSQPSRLLLLRRLRLPLPLTACRCRCGRLLDVFGHQSHSVRHSRSVGEAWVSIGVSRRKGLPRVRELDLHPGQNRVDARRLEVVVDGLELFNGAQLAVDTTLVSALRADGTVSRKGSNSGWRSPQKSAFFGVGESAECSGVHPNPSGTRMESEMEETFGMHSSKVVREHVAGARVANRCRRHNTLRG